MRSACKRNSLKLRTQQRGPAVNWRCGSVGTASGWPPWEPVQAKSAPSTTPRVRTGSFLNIPKVQMDLLASLLRTIFKLSAANEW